MRKQRRKLVAAAIVAALLTLFSQSTLAYYTVTGIATNVVTSGGVQLRIHETTADGYPFPEEGVTVIPGDVISKEVSVENVCEHPFWLRVQLVKGSTSETLDAQDALQVVEINDQEWIAHGEYYYFYRPLQPDERTIPLFEEVCIAGEAVDQYDVGSILTLTVKAHAVQSENNPAEHPWEASGWPEA